MSKSIISFLIFIALVLVVFVSSSVFANLGKNDVLPVMQNLPTSSTSSTLSTSNITNTPVTSATPVNTTTIPTTATVNTPTKDSVTSLGIKMVDVQKHNDQSSCWTVVNGGVFDLTSFVTPHPGGSKAILNLCGIDGTTAFVDQHGNQRRPNNELAGLKIGDLAK